MIWSEAAEQDRLVKSSGQSGTLSTDAIRRHSAMPSERMFSHVDARVSGFTFLLS